MLWLFFNFANTFTTGMWEDDYEQWTGKNLEVVIIYPSIYLVKLNETMKKLQFLTASLQAKNQTDDFTNMKGS
jgi:hypothetical protein